MNHISAKGDVSMSEAKLDARIVRVEIRDGKDGMFYAYSDDIRGLIIAEPSYDEVMREIPRVIAAMYAACGEKIAVFPAQRNNETEWVKMPLQMMKAELQAERV